MPTLRRWFAACVSLPRPQRPSNSRLGSPGSAQTFGFSRVGSSARAGANEVDGVDAYPSQVWLGAARSLPVEACCGAAATHPETPPLPTLSDTFLPADASPAAPALTATRAATSRPRRTAHSVPPITTTSRRQQRAARPIANCVSPFESGVPRFENSAPPSGPTTAVNNAWRARATDDRRVVSRLALPRRVSCSRHRPRSWG